MANNSGFSIEINPEGREDLVGKRFLLVQQSSPKPKLSRISDWNWKAGLIRCASHVDVTEKELQILVEYDDDVWDDREWLNVYKDNFQLLAVEQTLVLANRTSGPQPSLGHSHPALTFKPLVDTVGLYKGPKGSKLPVEFLSDLKLDFQDCNKLNSITHWDPAIAGLNTSSINEKKVNEWSEVQECQHLLTHGANFLSGMRLQVYRAEGTTQWYTAVTTGFNNSTMEYTLTDDTVLEEHYEDPRLTQMRLVGGKDVIDSIIRGDVITPRRNRSSALGGSNQQQQTASSLSNRSRSQTSSPPKKTRGQRPTQQPQHSPALVQDDSTNSSTESSSNTASTSNTRPRGRPPLKKDLPSKKKESKKETPEKKKVEDENSKKEKKSQEKQNSSSTKKQAKKSTTTEASKHDVSEDDSKSENDNDEQGNEEGEDTEEIENNETEDKGRGRKSVPKVKKVVKPSPRKKASKRSASVAALAAITTTQEAEAVADEELFKPQQIEAKKKAVAIVRPQPQQQQTVQQPPSDTSNTTSNTVPTEESNTTDREARFSLYDFPSDSESEERPLSSASKGHNKSSSDQKGGLTSSNKVGPPSSVVTNKGTTKPFKKFFPKTKKLLEKQPPPNNNSKEVTSTTTSKDATKMQEDVSVVQSSGTVVAERRSPDSGLSSSRPPTEAETRSGSRSSTLSVISDEPSVKKQPLPMGDRQPPQPPSAGSDLRRPQASPAPVGQPVSAANSLAAGQAAMSSQYALAAAQYQQALALAASGQNPNALAQAHQLFAQYQQLALSPEMLMKQYPQHLAAAGAMAGPPHLLGRPGADHHLLLQQAQREREIAAERERQQQRERREQEARERQEKERRERQERERLEQERRDREQRKQLSAAVAAEAVDHHFQLSIELAKKRMAVNNAAAAHSPWGPMPGAKPSMPGNGPAGPAHHPASLMSLEDERRRMESETRRSQELFINSLRPPQGSMNSLHPSLGGGALTGGVPPPAHGSASRPLSSSSSTSKHSLPPSTVTAPPHSASLHNKPSLHHLHKVDPGPPPPLAPLSVAHGAGHYKPQSNAAVTFKPYDFGRRDISPRSTSSVSSGSGTSHPATTYSSYPTAYSAPPPARPKVTSPQVVNLYSKPIPARPESVPAVVPGGGASVAGPPPAHSSLPPGSRAPPPTKHLLPPPLAHSHPSSGPRPQSEEDMPLDLGAPSKRKLESPSEDPEAGITPSKNVKLEENGQLHKVSEPSVLMTSEVNITTVENLVLKPDNNIKTEDMKTEIKTEAPTSPPTYVHKLKKAWIKSYVDEKPATGGSSDTNTTKVESSYSSPSTPNNNNSRATPSPALSTVSAASKGGRGRVNGHASSSTRNEESESSDSGSGRSKKDRKETSKSNGPTRGGKKGPKGHASTVRGRGSGRLRTTKASDNDTLSDSDDNSKDSDNTTISRTSRTASSNASQKGKRGRKPGRKNGRGGGVSRNEQSDDATDSGVVTHNGSKNKKTSNQRQSRDTIEEKENPFNKPPVQELKKTGASFLQDSDCFRVAPKLGKCRECKWSQHNKNSGSASIFCRFYGFRRLKYKNGQVVVAGFCDPRDKDTTQDDADMWEASADNAPEGLTVDQAKYCLELLKTDFDLIVKEERQAIQENIGDEGSSWKRVVQGVSESCDVCDATLFNLHWACPRCGFVVCLHCYVTRKTHGDLANGESKSESGAGSSVTKDDKDKFEWLLCTNRSQHDLDKLMLTQIVTGDALEELTEKLNNCGVKFRIANAASKGKLNGVTANGKESNNSATNKGASLRDLIGSEQKVKMSDIIDACVEDSMEEQQDMELKHFVRKTDLEEDQTYKWRHGFAPKRRTYSLFDTKSQYSSVQHCWLANGHVLRMDGPSTDSPAVVDLFQEIWSRGQPVVVTNSTKALTSSKWYPTTLNEDFGDETAEFINVKTNQSMGEYPLKKFWDGFANVQKRLKDDKGQPSVIRLSGWPGNFGEEFKENLPNRSAEFLRTLPMPCYTGRAGPLNLAASLPDTFARAEVGPRAVITYGDADPSLISIGLRNERADSVVVCIHAQIPKNDEIDSEAFRANAINTMETLGCDTSAISKAREERLPAAIWTLFHPADGDKIRDFLNKGLKAVDKKEKLSANHDPILDNVALDEGQLKKLKEEYNVKPYVIAQFLGEALFIPAGSLRQVKHLLSSISLESDFMSPENVSQSFFMYRQLRHLPESQKQPIEDNLSVKNLIFHSVKNALATLERNKINGSKDEDNNKDDDDEEDN